MDATILVALIAAAAVLIGGYLTNFLAEDYRRFLDGKALAAALAGELDSYAGVLPELRQRLDAMYKSASGGNALSLHELPQPTDPVFDASVEKLGLLGVDLAGRVSFHYGELRKFRAGFWYLMRHHAKLDPSENALRLQVCIKVIDDSSGSATKLILDLKTYAHRTWKEKTAAQATGKYY